MKKPCKKCNREFPITYFVKHKTSKEGYSHICKSCQRKYNKQYRKLNKVSIRLNKSKEYRLNRNKYLERELVRKYGINLIQYNEILKDQNSCCNICRIPQSQCLRAFDVDHCHSTNKVRGLLCNLCNIGLGSFRDNVEYLGNAISYLNKYPFEKALYL